MKITREELDEKLRACIGPGKALTYSPAEGLRLNGVGESEKRIAKIYSLRLGLPAYLVEAGLASFAVEEEQRLWRETRAWVENMDTQPVDEAPLRRFLAGLAEAEMGSAEFEAHVWAMKQWIWQVKRHILQKSVEWHICVNFWSRVGGTGKSYNVQRIFEPLRSYSRSLTLTQITDQFVGYSMAHCLIAYFEEFSKADKVDVPSFKGFLSGKDFYGRLPHSERPSHQKNITSCIGTSNYPPPHGFNDDTGARRFWSIRVRNERMDDTPSRRDSLDAIVPAQLWRCCKASDVSPHATTPKHILRHMAEVRERDLRAKTALETFWEEEVRDDPGNELLIRDLVPALKRWASMTGYKLGRTSQLELVRQLKELLPGANVVSTNRYYRVRDCGFVRDLDDIPLTRAG